MNKRIGFVLGFILFAALGSIIVYSSKIGPLPSVAQPILYNIDPETIIGARKVDEFKDLVISTWDLPQINYDVKVSATKDMQYGLNMLLFKFYHDGDYVLSAKINAETGQILSIADHRYSGTSNTTAATEALHAAADSAIARMGVDISSLPNPRIISPPTGSATNCLYTIIWDQYYTGIPVDNGFIRVVVDSEYLKPVVFSNGLVEIGNVDINPTVSEAKATAAAEEYLKTGILEIKGYLGCKIGSATLYITRPDYDPYNNKVYAPALNACLAWKVSCTDQDGCIVDIVIDAHNGKIISLTEYK